MIENIRVEFMQVLKETDWLDEQSRKLALEKVIFGNIKKSLYFICKRLRILIAKLATQILSIIRLI